MANPRHEGRQDASHQSTNSWDEPATDAGQDESQQAPAVQWAKVQSLAVLTGVSTLGAVVVLQLAGMTDLPKMAYDSIPESVQEAFPAQQGPKQHQNTPQPFNLGAIVHKAQVHIPTQLFASAAAHQKWRHFCQGRPLCCDLLQNPIENSVSWVILPHFVHPDLILLEAPFLQAWSVKSAC